MVIEKKQKNNQQRKFVARLKNLSMTPRKVRLVTDSLSKKTITEALVLLNETPKRAALPVLKLMNSVIANATSKDKVNFNDLNIFSIMVNEGRKLKRFRPRARGKTYPIIKRSSHIEIILIESQNEIKETIKPIKKGGVK